ARRPMDGCPGDPRPGDAALVARWSIRRRTTALVRWPPAGPDAGVGTSTDHRHRGRHRTAVGVGHPSARPREDAVEHVVRLGRGGVRALVIAREGDSYAMRLADLDAGRVVPLLALDRAHSLAVGAWDGVAWDR